MTRGRETNGAYIYETATEQEYGLNPLPGSHVMCRGTAQHAGRLARAIIANHDQPITAHEFAAQTPSTALPEYVRRIHDRRAATVQRPRSVSKPLGSLSDVCPSRLSAIASVTNVFA